MIAKIIGFIVAFIAVIVYFLFQILNAPLYPPKIDTAKHWGPSSLAKQEVATTEAKPFKIDYSADVITKLGNRLKEPLNLVEPLEDVGFRYGFNKYKLEELINYWRDDYLPRWSERQNYLNKFPQFTTTIQGYVFYLFIENFLHQFRY